MQNGKCYMHGGAQPRGLASVTTREGRYSKYFPTAITDRARACVEDPELMSTREEIALCRSRIQGLGQLIAVGEGDAKTWDAIGDSMDRVARLLDREYKRLEVLGAMVTADQVQMIALGVLEAVRKHVTDHDQRTALLRDLQAVLQR